MNLPSHFSPFFSFMMPRSDPPPCDLSSTFLVAFPGIRLFLFHPPFPKHDRLPSRRRLELFPFFFAQPPPFFFFNSWAVGILGAAGRRPSLPFPSPSQPDRPFIFPFPQRENVLFFPSIWFVVLVLCCDCVLLCFWPVFFGPFFDLQNHDVPFFARISLFLQAFRRSPPPFSCSFCLTCRIFVPTLSASVPSSFGSFFRSFRRFLGSLLQSPPRWRSLIERFFPWTAQLALPPPPFFFLRPKDDPDPDHRQRGSPLSPVFFFSKSFFPPVYLLTRREDCGFYR